MESNRSARDARKRRHLVLFVAALGVFGAHSYACDVQLSLIPFPQGLQKERKGDSLEKARASNIDLTTRTEPFVVSQLDGKRLFFLFYNDATITDRRPEFLIQKSKRTERNFRSASDSAPETSTEYMVETFKLADGHLKGLDRHHGVFRLGKFHRREIVKELEIGCGSIPQTLEGFAWPYVGKQYRQLQPYGSDEGLYGKVQFTGSKKWTLTAAFDANGAYSIRSEALAVSAP